MKNFKVGTNRSDLECRACGASLLGGQNIYSFMEMKA